MKMEGLKMNDGEQLFWRIRRTIGLRDNDVDPEADAVIRFEIETVPGNSVNINVIRKRLGLPITEL